MLFRPIWVRVWIETGKREVDAQSPWLQLAATVFRSTNSDGGSARHCLAGADRKDLMGKLPKFIYDEEKTLERTCKILTEKIAQLNSAIDDVSAQLHGDDAPNGVAVNSDEVGASM
uniref:Uncharacterized protein n=1 Tax=Quercus lobata TaxID=97700 RepID=A0A7N2MUU3_QUELO